jgi:transposase
MKSVGIRRTVRSIDTSNQLSLLSEPQSEALAEANRFKQAEAAVRFEEKDPKRIFINEVRLDKHLQAMGLKTPFKVRELLEAMSLAALEEAYKGGGRRPYAPRWMLGLILYGLMQGISSLRDLEKMAKVEIGCWWVTGGILPDHSVIGRFIQLHDEWLSGEIFHELLRQIIRVTGTTTTVVAGDGTVLEAAVSRYGLLRQEALQGKLAALRTQDPIDHQASQAKLAQLTQAEAMLGARQAVRRAKGKAASRLTIHPLEPEARVQPQKDKGRFRASYKPQVLANEARLIVACDVHPSSETALLSGLLDRASEHGPIKTVLLDANYFSAGVIQNMATREIELLCPQGQSIGDNWDKQSAKQFNKSEFIYEAKDDHYTCPAGQTLRAVERDKGSASRQGYVKYATPACLNCSLRERCTTSKVGRSIKRYAIDTMKDLLRTKMKDVTVRARYRQRQAMVEPVFSHLRIRQGLNRFRRKGLKGVRVEFALHAMAYNLSRLVALCHSISFFIYRDYRIGILAITQQRMSYLLFRHFA